MIDGRYELLEVVGSGGMGKVYRARDRVLDRIVAVKVIREDLVDDEFLRRFEREAAILARVRSPHIVVVFDYGNSDGRFYLVTDFLADGDLAHVLQQGPMAPRDAAALLAQLSDGLADAHENGVIHRDIKPGNVLLWRRAGALQPVLADFGIAVTADLGLTATGGVIGSPPFMAPERHLGRAATAATDIYAMGCLAFNVLTGAPPFQGTGFQMANAHINDPVPPLPRAIPDADAWDSVIRRCMEKEPADRYGSAAELASAFRRLAAPPSPPPPAPVVAPRTELPTTQAKPPHPAPPVRRRRRAPLIALLAVVLLVATAGAAWWLLRDEPTPRAAAPAPQDPGTVKAAVEPANLGVAVTVHLPVPDAGTSVVLERKDDQGVWRESDPELDMDTTEGGKRACAVLRLVAVKADRRTEGQESEVCGRALPREVELVASPSGACAYPLDAPAPDGSTTTPCRWVDAVLTGFKPDQTFVVRLFWIIDGETRPDVAYVRVHTDENGAGAAGEHAASSAYGGLCPARHCAGGFAVPDLVTEIEARVVDSNGKLVEKAGPRRRP